jgi:hypothetical protein
MIIKKLTQSALLTSVFSFSQFAQAQCAQQVQVDMGEISQQLSIQDEDHLLTPEMSLDKKYEYATNVLAGKTHVLVYRGTQANGNTRRCKYQSNERPELKVELKQANGRSIELTMSADLETDTDDNDFYIYHNQIVLKQRLTRSRSLNRGSKAFAGTLQSRNHYYYSCGFTDCTYTNDELNKLANTGVRVSWN